MIEIDTTGRDDSRLLDITGHWKTEQFTPGCPVLFFNRRQRYPAVATQMLLQTPGIRHKFACPHEL
jgi:hypothetical protein